VPGTDDPALEDRRAAGAPSSGASRQRPRRDRCRDPSNRVTTPDSARVDALTRRHRASRRAPGPTGLVATNSTRRCRGAALVVDVERRQQLARRARDGSSPSPLDRVTSSEARVRRSASDSCRLHESSHRGRDGRGAAGRSSFRRESGLERRVEQPSSSAAPAREPRTEISMGSPGRCSRSIAPSLNSSSTERNRATRSVRVRPDVSSVKVRTRSSSRMASTSSAASRTLIVERRMWWRSTTRLGHRRGDRGGEGGELRGRQRDGDRPQHAEHPRLRCGLAREPPGVVLVAVAEDPGEITVGLVLEQACVEAVAGLAEQVLDLLALLDGEQARGLELDERRRDHEEPGRGLEVDRVEAVAQRAHVVRRDVGEVDLGDLDLTPRDQVQEEVEGPLEHVELHLVRHQGSSVRQGHVAAGGRRSLAPTPPARRRARRVGASSADQDPVNRCADGPAAPGRIWVRSARSDGRRAASAAAAHPPRHGRGCGPGLGPGVRTDDVADADVTSSPTAGSTRSPARWRPAPSPRRSPRAAGRRSSARPGRGASRDDRGRGRCATRIVDHGGIAALRDDELPGSVERRALVEQAVTSSSASTRPRPSSSSVPAASASETSRSRAPLRPGGPRWPPHLERVADRVPERLGHVGDQRCRPPTVGDADAHAQLGERDGRLDGRTERTVAGLDVEHDRRCPTGDLLAHHARGDQRRRGDGRRDVTQRVQALVRRDEVGGRRSDGETDLRRPARGPAAIVRSVRSPGMASSLSIVPPVCPRPRPESFATWQPAAASSGATTNVVVSPTPPVECLSTVGPRSPERSTVSPEATNASVSATASASVKASDHAGHEQRRHLRVVDLALEVAGEQPRISSPVSSPPSRLRAISSGIGVRSLGIRTLHDPRRTVQGDYAQRRCAAGRRAGRRAPAGGRDGGGSGGRTPDQARGCARA
jgi:hypothetical protein